MSITSREGGRDAWLTAIEKAGRENSTATVMFHNSVAAILKLNPTDEKTIDILLRRGPLTAGEIGEETSLATASVTGLIDRLEKRGFVKRVRDQHDRRRVIVEVVQERVREMAAIFEPFATSFRQLLEEYEDDQLETILDFLTRTTERLRQETAHLQREEHEQA